MLRRKDNGYLDSSDTQYSWFGRAWRNALWAINQNKALITSIAGPVVGGILSKLIDAGVKISGLELGRSIPGESTLTFLEKQKFNTFLKEILLPSLKPIFDPFNITVQQFSFGRLDPKTLANSVNDALLKLAALNTHALSLEANGEKGASVNLVREKSLFIMRLVANLEKALIIYVEENLPGLQLVEESVKVSDIKQIGNLSLNFHNQTAVAKVKKYIEKGTQPNPNQDVVVNVNTNIDDQPVTPTTTTPTINTSDNPTTEKTKSNTLKYVGIAGLAFAFGVMFQSSKEKEKNKN